MATEIENGFTNFKKAPVPKRVAYFIWQKPWMCTGGDTFISDVITKIGWQNALADLLQHGSTNDNRSTTPLFAICEL